SRTAMPDADLTSEGKTAANENAAAKGKWADHIFLISSVSGGSLATADYVVRGLVDRPTGLLNIDDLELQTLMDQHLRVLTAEQQEHPDESPTLAADIEFAKQQLPQPQNCTAAYHWLLSSSFVDDMATDFMAPIL